MDKYINRVQKCLNKYKKEMNKSRGTESSEHKQMREFGRRDAKLRSIKFSTQGGQ